MSNAWTDAIPILDFTKLCLAEQCFSSENSYFAALKRLIFLILILAKSWHKGMKKTILLLTAVFIFNLSLSAPHLEFKKAKFIDAKPGECWRINDDWTRIYDKVESSYDDFRYIFRNKYSLTWHDIEHTKALLDKYKHVFVLETTGYVARWKYVKYGKISNGNLCIKYGWLLATTVEDAEKK